MSQSNPTRILYMEDDAGLARLLQKRLQRVGYEVDLAYNGEMGLTMYQAKDYDVVAVDQKMPVYDGLEVIRTLSTLGPLPPIIMITGAGNEEIAIEAMKLGAGDYLVKDVDGGYLELLPSVIEQVLYQRRLVEERQEAIKAVQQVNRNLALLTLVGQKLAATLNLQEIFDLLLQAVTETIGAEGSSVWLQAEDDIGGLVCHAAYLNDQYQSPVNMRLQNGEGVAGWVIENGRAVVISNVGDDPRHSPLIDTKIEFETASILAVPLRLGNRIFGALEVVNKFDGQFNSDDQSMLETLAASAAIAIENARLVTTLRRQTEELQTRNGELDAFAHTVAHDLKSPLGPLMGLAEFLEQHRQIISEDDVNKSLSSIKRGCIKMNNIIDELLLLAQMRDTEIDLTPLNMETIVQESRQRLSFMIEETQAELNLPENWPDALGYGPWIEEVWVNYISNAIKYGGQPPRVELGAKHIDECKIRFWVQDNGAGLSPQEQAELFIPFSQLDKIRAEGHGLGLSIVRRIVDRLGGEVGVESKGDLDQGSLFYFTLPTVPKENGNNA